MSNSTKSDKHLPTEVMRRKAPIPITQLFDFKTEADTGPFLLHVNASTDGVLLAPWGAQHKAFLDEALLRYGAVLLRGFCLEGLDDFFVFAEQTCGPPLQYRERSSPRRLLKPGVYSSTDYHANERIFFHNENSYQQQWPQRILFHCVIPPEERGETPLASIRTVTDEISPIIRRKFAEKGVLYVRNFGTHLGLPWETVFQTSQRDEVERYCRANEMECEWIGNSLQTRARRPALVRHTHTGEELWFNHAAFFHLSTLPLEIQNGLLCELKEENLPSNTYYGDGTPIEPSVLDEIRNAYEGASARFPWRRGDVLMLDNMLIAHAREPYVGARQIVVAMAEAASGFRDQTSR
jgi:alpha-ketoglutarate-dependent taurine dioxygenase